MDSVTGSRTTITGGEEERGEEGRGEEGRGGEGGGGEGGEGYPYIIHHGGCSPQTVPSSIKLLLTQTPAVTTSTV